MGHSKIAPQIFFRIVALLLADDHDRLLIQKSESAKSRQIIAESAVPMNFEKIGEYPLDMIRNIGPLGMAGNLNPFPGSQFTGRPLGDQRRFHGTFGFFHDEFKPF